MRAAPVLAKKLKMAVIELRPVRVLIVEDSADDVKLVLRALRLGGFAATHTRVQTAADFTAALADGRWDAVLSDFAMPGFTGLDALRIFRAAGADIPFILVSGTIGEEFAADAMKAGASDYVMKGNLARLAPALERELAESAMRADLRVAHLALTASEKQFRQMADNVGDVFYLVDAVTGRILYVNAAYEGISGRTIPSLLGNPWIDAVHPNDRAAVLEENRAGVVEHEYRILRPDGTTRWIASTGFPVRDDDGKVVRIAGVAKDITERKAVAGQLRESERRFSELLANVELASVMLDREGRITYCNGYLLRLSGWRLAEVIGKDWFDTFMPAELGDMKPVFAALLLNAPEAWHRDNEIFTRSGERRMIRWNNSVLRDGAGVVVGVASIGEDITEQRRAEEDLRRSSGAMDAIADAVLMVDRSSMRFVHVNDAACRYLNRAREQVLALAPWEALSTTRAELESSYDQLIARGKPARPIELLRSRPDGTPAWIEVRRHAQRTADRWTIVTLIREITGRKKAEQALSESERRFSDLLANVQLVSAMLDSAGRITYCNEYLLRLTGWRLEEVMGRDWFEVFLPLGQDEMKRVFAALLADLPASRHYENEIFTRSGERRLIRWNNSVLRSSEGEVVGTASIGEDITERKQVEEANHRFAAAMNATSDAIYLVDRASMRFLHVNDAACRIQGYTREELIALGPGGAPAAAGGGPRSALGSSREELERIYDAIIASGVPAAPLEVLRTRKDGSQFWVEYRRQALPSAEGWTIVTLIRDITEQKKRDDNLRRFRASMEISGDGIVLVDRASLRYIDVNQTICDMIGRTREEILGLTPMDVFNVTRETVERDYDALIADNKSSAGKIEGSYRHADGSTFPVETRRGALRTDGGWVIVATVRDISERKAAQDRIVYLNRVYAVLSGINTLIVRASDRDQMFAEACRIAIEAGGFRMAWIGVLEDVSSNVVLVASAGGTGELLAALQERYRPNAGQMPVDSLAARAVREKKPVVSNEIHVDSTIALGRKHDAAGIRSMAILPLLVGEKAVGALALYAGENEFFHLEELKLLTELAGDIAFAIDHIAKRERLEYLAYYDVLTGLANRSLFLERVAQYMRSAAGGGHKLAVFFIDIERFKNINDSLGRPAGDALLRQVADWLKASCGDASLVARLGADHFAVVMPKVNVDGDVTRFVENRIESFREHQFSLNDASFRIAIKIGVALFPDHGDEADTLLRNAEAALKRAKAKGDRYLFYKQKMTDRGAGKLTLENKLRDALEREEYVLYYQPKVNLHTGKLTSAEALIRWNDPATGLVPPGHFIPILEETGLIHDVGRWALRKAVAEYLRWKAAGLPAVRVAVNVSPLQLRDRGFVAEVERVIGIDPLAPGGLELEITESLIMEDVKHSIASLQAIRALGLTIAIDDFGTGFSSLSYLSKLPVDTLKIDRSFVIDMTGGPDGLSLVSTIINLAHAFKLKVVAEGVETEEQSRLLRLLDCNEMQGYLFSRPVPAAEFEAKFLALPAGEPGQGP
jgi:diguanylate cyclase (GGDEF)-like protein/PAS domain S-box-containing protein